MSRRARENKNRQDQQIEVAEFLLKQFRGRSTDIKFETVGGFRHPRAVGIRRTESYDHVC